MLEHYQEADGGQRTVQYFDKARMEESTKPNADFDSVWSVTTGLLAWELVTGKLQLGDTRFEQHNPSHANVAGDPTDSNVPTYAVMGQHLDDPPAIAGTVITATLDRFGNAGDDPTLASHNVTAAEYAEQTRHTVASVFWAFMNSEGLIYEDGGFVTGKLFQNPYYATGYPLTEAFWTTVRVGGVLKRVLVQVFERRVLTYTPDNPEGWKVEAGNIGQHYHHWRYTEIPNEVTPTPVTPSPSATPVTPSPSPTETEPSGTTGDLQFEYIQPALPGDTTAENERVVIRNMQLSGPVNMQGWKMRDSEGNTYTFPDVTVKAGFYVEVRICNGQDIIEPKYAILYWGRCEPFYTPPDTITLIDSFGDVVDTYP
jgi:hypothetical protein